MGERDYSAQETCHLLLQLPMFKASRDFVILSLDGSRAVEDHLEEGQRATALSIVDHYMGRPNSPHFNDMTLLEFARQYSMPKSLGCEPSRRSRRIVVIPRPYVSPDPAGNKYEQYCCQSLMQHKCFRQMDDMTTTSMHTLPSCSLATFHPVWKMICIVFFSTHKVLRMTVRTRR